MCVCVYIHTQISRLEKDTKNRVILKKKVTAIEIKSYKLKNILIKLDHI